MQAQRLTVEIERLNGDIRSITAEISGSDSRIAVLETTGTTPARAPAPCRTSWPGPDRPGGRPPPSWNARKPRPPRWTARPPPSPQRSRRWKAAGPAAEPHRRASARQAELRADPRRRHQPGDGRPGAGGRGPRRRRIGPGPPARSPGRGRGRAGPPGRAAGKPRRYPQVSGYAGGQRAAAGQRPGRAGLDNWPTAKGPGRSVRRRGGAEPHQGTPPPSGWPFCRSWKRTWRATSTRSGR